MSKICTESVDVRQLAVLQAAADFLGVSRQTVYEWRKQGILPEYRLGSTKRVCFKWSDLEALKAERDSSTIEGK